MDGEVVSYGTPLNDGLTAHLTMADIVVVDVTELNPNVYYELGFVTALKKPRILIRSRSAATDGLPSDIAGTLLLHYDSVNSVIGRLADRIRDCALEALRVEARNLERCRTVWGNLDKTGKPVVVLGPRSSSKTDFMDISSVNYMFLDSFGDKDSIFELSLLMTRLFPRAPVVRYVSDDFPRDAYDHNLLVIGGPGIPGSQGNRLVNTLHRRLGIDVGYSADATSIVLPDGTEHAASFEDGRCTVDYGFFARARNPFNPGAHLFMCHGIYTMGVLGAARLLSDHPAAQENLELVLAELGADAEFWSVFPVQVLNGVPMVPTLKPEMLNTI